MGGGSSRDWQSEVNHLQRRLNQSNRTIQEKVEELKKLQNLLNDAIEKKEEAIEMKKRAELDRDRIEARRIMQEALNEQQLAEAEKLKKEAIERVNKYIEENETKKIKAAEEEKKAKDLIEKKKNELKKLRSSNACDQENIDIIQAKIKEAEKIKREAEIIEREAEKKQREAEKKQEEAEKQRQNEEKRTERIKELQKFEIAVEFNQIPENSTIRSTEIGDNSPTSTSPIQIECFTNPEKFSDSVDESINNIYTNHYEHNLKTYMQNKILINEMEDKINNINSRLQHKMNKNINYGPDGQLTFY